MNKTLCAPLLSILCLLLLCLSLPACAENPSGRPVIYQHSIRTSEGTPLRGTTISTEGNPPGEFVMTSEDMRVLTENGLNALHIYVERQSDGLPIGSSVENCDYLIDLAEEHGVYVVLTIGEMRVEPEWFALDTQFIYDFWTFYAPRYADREHVLYEICNEVPLAYDIAEIQATTYRLIRSHAPDTMVLFYSLSNTIEMDRALEYIAQTDALIAEPELWQNAALAFHGYECTEDSMGSAQFRNVIHTLTRAGYPLINTELPNRFEQSGYPDPELLRICEEEAISWLSFVFHTRISEPSFWRGQLEAAGVSWKPDQYDWPVEGSLYPFGRLPAWQSYEATAEYTTDQRKTIFFMEQGDYIGFPNVQFGTREPLSYTITLQADQDGEIAIRTGGFDGPEIGRCAFTATDGHYVPFTDYLLTPIDGLVSLYLTLETDAAVRFEDLTFHLPAQAGYTDPNDGVIHAYLYPFRTGEIRRAPSTDTASQAPLQVEGIVDGSSLLFDFVSFHGKDVILHIRAMPMAGGSIEIRAGDQGIERYELGICEIDGTAGQWQEYTCRIDQSTLLMFDPYTQRWNLELLFHGESDDPLFALSEFWFEAL